MFGLPSFDSILLNVGKLAMYGPLGAIATGAGDIDRSADAIATALGDQSPESIAARNRIKDLTDNHFDGDFHNQRIPDSLFGNVRSEDLAELSRKAQAIDVGVMAALQQMWKARAEKLETGLGQFGPEILSAIAESWEGAAKDAAAQGIVDYVNKAQNMVSATKIVADKVEIVKSAVEVTKANVQSPPNTGWASTVASWIPGPTWKMDRDRTDAAELATYTVLEKVYQPGIREGDTGQPRIPLAYNPVQDNGGTPPPPGTHSGTATSGGASATSSSAGADNVDTSGTGEQGGGSTGVSGAGSGQGNGVDQAGANALGGAGTGSTGAGNSESTTTAGIDSAASPSGVGGGASPGTGFGVPGGSGAGAGSPHGGAGASGGIGSPGSSVPGSPGGAVVGAGASGSGSSGRGGSSGVGGMAPGAGRGKGDEDKEKGKSAIAEALVDRRNGEELTGMDPEHRPSTVPPVLGE